MQFFLFLFLLVAGAVSALSPETAWHLGEGWKFRDAEPSEAWLRWCRISGVIEIIVAFVIVFTM